MPRLAGLDAPGVVHHVIIRGIEHRKLFRKSKDRDDMMDRRYELRNLGYTIEKLEERVLGIYRIDRDELYSKGR